MLKPFKPVVVKEGNVGMTIIQLEDGAFRFEDKSSGKRIRKTFRTLEKAQEKAKDLAIFLANRNNSVLRIPQADLASFYQWQEEQHKFDLPIGEAVEKFLALKTDLRKRSLYALQNQLQRFLNYVGSTRLIREIKTPDIQGFLDDRPIGPRTKFGLRETLVSLFKWARDYGHLPEQRKTEAEKVYKPEKTIGTPNILLADQVRTLINKVEDKYFPWLVIAAFAGIRSEEIAPGYMSDKDPLRWEDFDWDNNEIVVRAETSKVHEERGVPIQPNLAELLRSYRRATGPVLGNAQAPTKGCTTRLGQHLPGGWKSNYLRDSYCSYRTAITQNPNQVAYEMGNSVAVKKSYNRRQSVKPAKAYFAVNSRPVPGNVIKVGFGKNCQKLPRIQQTRAGLRAS